MLRRLSSPTLVGVEKLGKLTAARSVRLGEAARRLAREEGLADRVEFRQAIAALISRRKV
jgi:hypothetical protein